MCIITSSSVDLEIVLATFAKHSLEQDMKAELNMARNLP